MTESINSLEKKESMNSEVLLDWKEYDDDEEEEEDKNENSQEKEKESYSKKQSENIEESSYNNNSYHGKRGNKDYSYSNNTYGYKKSYNHYGSKNYGYKKYGKSSKPYNKGYDSGYDKGYDNNYYSSNTHYKKWQNSDSSYYGKYKERDNYHDHKKMIEKEIDYDEVKNDTDKKDENENKEIIIDFKKNIDRKNFTSGNNKYYNSNKKYNYNQKYNKNYSGYNSKEYNDDKKPENKNNKFRRFKEEELSDKGEEEDIKKPQFYNSKIQGAQDIPPQIKNIKIEDFIDVSNLKEEINKIVKETYMELKAQIDKDLEEQYGSLNINAKTYVPKKKILGNNMNNYGPNFINNNSNIFPQNAPPSY